MADRCPGASVIGRAILAGHRFQIGAAGYGTVVADPTGEVPGILWELTPDDEAALDRYEGVAEGLYLKDQGTVTLADGRRAPAMLYLAADPAPGSPQPGYLERIVELGAELGFPTSYLDTLRKLLSPR